MLFYCTVYLIVKCNWLAAQRSATDLPQIESCSPVSCLVSGGEEMVITGSNISPESKVIFLEKSPGKRW